MDIYVVSKLWRTDGAFGDGMVIGAGVTLEDAQAVADRWDCRPGRWGTWSAAAGSGARSQRWQREVIGRDGRTFGQNGQEIVRIPLAGKAVRVPDPLIEEATTMTARGHVSEGQAVHYGQEIQEIGRAYGAP